MYRQKYLTQAEIERLMNESSDEEETASLISSANNVELVLLPPNTVDELSDVEAIDGNVQILNDPSAFMPGEVAGEIEVVCDINDCNQNKPDRHCVRPKAIATRSFHMVALEQLQIQITPTMDWEKPLC